MFKVSWDEKWIAQKQMIVTHRTDAPVRTTSSIIEIACMQHDEEQKKKKKKEKKRATTNKESGTQQQLYLFVVSTCLGSRRCPLLRK